MKKKVRDAEKVSAWDAQAVASQGPTCKVPAVANGGAASWAENVLGGGSRRLAVLIGAAGLCLCFYAILATFTSHPCWHSLHCSKKLVTGQHAVLHDEEMAGHNHHKNPLSAKYKPRNLPAQGHAFAASSSSSTNLSHIVFGIAASSSLWNRRKEYIKLWWRPQEMRGFVWLDKAVNRTSDEKLLPPVRISPDTSRFKYTNKLGRRSAIRISRIVSDTFRLGLPDVHWFVMGDDDTLFVPENLVKVLSKYDHRQYYYIGSTSESHLQNIMFSYNMAYGGGGFAISYPLAKALEKMQDGCLQRYPSLFGSDDRIQACMSELGVPLTREAGFHQYDIYGNLFGLIATHPITPAVSLHHLDVVEPIFPNTTRVQSLRHLQKAIKADPYGFLQQSICYDSQKQWSISLSWGFALQIYRGIFLPRELELPPRTFYNWHKRGDHTAYAFNTRPFSRNPCQKPFIFYMHNISSSANKTGRMESMYYKEEKNPPECKWKMTSPETLESVKVVRQKDDSMWNKGPRRKCCHVAASASTSTTLEINVRDCEPGEVAIADRPLQEKKAD